MKTNPLFESLFFVQILLILPAPGDVTASFGLHLFLFDLIDSVEPDIHLNSRGLISMVIINKSITNQSINNNKSITNQSIIDNN